MAGGQDLLVVALEKIPIDVFAFRLEQRQAFERALRRARPGATIDALGDLAQQPAAELPAAGDVVELERNTRMQNGRSVSTKQSVKLLNGKPTWSAHSQTSPACNT